MPGKVGATRLTTVCREIRAQLEAAATLAEQASRVERDLLTPAEGVRNAARATFREGATDVLKLVDAERVYVVWGAPESLLVQAFDHAGKPVWSTDLGPHPSQHGYGGSPMIYEDLLIVGNDQDGVSALVALDRRTGEKRWSTPRRRRLTKR